MNFFTQPRLAKEIFRQLVTDELILSGTTDFVGTLKSKGIEIDATADNLKHQYVLTYDDFLGKIELKPSSASGSTTNFENIGGGSGELFVTGNTGTTGEIRTISGGSGMSVNTIGDVVLLESQGGTLGIPDDGTYTDGLFPWTASTKSSNAFDDVNEFLGLLAPQQPPILNNQTTSGAFVAGKLSFGPSRNDIAYVNATTAGGGTAFDINGNYTISGNRRGITKSSINGVLNDNTVGDSSGIPFLDNSFRDGDKGSIVVELNGSIIETIDLTSTTAAISGTFVSVSSTTPVKFDNGNDFGSLVYRTGTFSIPTTSFVDGYNYVRILHTGSTIGSRTTNFTQWIYDPESTPISGGSSSISNIDLNGSFFMSGVEYNTSGNLDFNLTASNVYKNVYSNSSTALSFPNRVNLGQPTSISIIGSGIINGTSQALPNLDSTQSDPQDTDIDIVASMPINVNKVLGNLSQVSSINGLANGELSTNIRILHPFATKEFISSQENELGFLIYNVTPTSNNTFEDLNSEIDRLQFRDYTTLLYSNINANSYAWSSTQDLITGDVRHNTGMLVFNGSLYYPDSTLLSTEYGIASGNFDAITNGPASNANYSTASGKRNFIRKFKSENTQTQSTLTFQINHSGVIGDFLTNGGTAGSPTGNEIKFEFLIKRANGSTHGWANPFASTGNPEGIASTSISQVAGIAEVTCTLSTTPRVANDDIVIVRMFFGSTYINKINSISIVNIN